MNQPTGAACGRGPAKDLVRECGERANRHGMGSSWSDELPGEETK
ncbi:hypothetical protein [Streptosporangium subroseum]|nr:hypothetical protein [Streptosporangium subroseum]